MSKTGPGPAVEFGRRIELSKVFFERLEADYRISLDDELRTEMREICLTYAIGKKVNDARPNFSDVRKRFETIQKSSLSLTKALNSICQDEPAAQVTELRLELRTERFGDLNFICGLLARLHMLNCACNTELSDLKKRFGGKRGRGENWFLDNFIHEAAKLFREAGGHPAAHNQCKDGKSRPDGPFVRFVQDLNKKLPLEVQSADSALASRAHEVLHPRPKNRGRKKQNKFLRPF